MTIYKVDGRIRYSEVGQDGLLTIPALIDYFQDCSTFQSEDLEIGVARLKQNHMAWLVNYWQVDILRLPALLPVYVLSLGPVLAVVERLALRRQGNIELPLVALQPGAGEQALFFQPFQKGSQGPGIQVHLPAKLPLRHAAKFPEHHHHDVLRVCQPQLLQRPPILPDHFLCAGI